MTPQERRNWTGPILEIYADIESWRDWHWQWALWCKDNGFDYASELNGNVARAYNAAITILESDKNIIPIVRENLDDYQQYKYGEWPE